MLFVARLLSFPLPQRSQVARLSESQTTFARMEAKSCVWHTSGGPEGISAGLAPDLVEDQNQMNRDVDSLK